MNTAPLQSAMRQLRHRLTRPVTVTALAAVALVVGISGPFGTQAIFDLPARMAYWACVVPMTYALGFIGSVLVEPYFTGKHTLLRVAAHALGSTVLVSLLLTALNAALGLHIGGLPEYMRGFAAVYCICIAVESVGAAIDLQSPAKTPAILARLPIEKRGGLVALQVQDHYVQVTTTRGSALVLMRLSDAIAECAPTAGLHVHRSHWVAADHVTRAARRKDAAVLWLNTGAEIPVSRARMSAVISAGLLPRKPE